MVEIKSPIPDIDNKNMKMQQYIRRYPLSAGMRKIILEATAENIEGPFTEGRVISAQSWVEGPSALLIGSDWIVYYDCYRDGKYGAVRSRNGGNWEDVANLISFPKGTRHGTAFEVDQDIYDNLVKQFGVAE